jgi:hypothetical protein
MEFEAIDNSKRNDPPFMVWDNCIHENDQKKIEDALTEANFQWSYNYHTAGELENSSHLNIYETSQFVHPIQDMRGGVFSTYDWVANIITESLKQNLEMEIELVDRIKANYLHANPKFKRGMYHTPHCDKHLEGGQDQPWISAIYYVNESDGDTYFFNKFYGDYTGDMFNISQVSPRRGRIIIFHSTRYHASSCPLEYDKRMILNCVYKVKENS